MAATAGGPLGLQGASPVQRRVVNRVGGTLAVGDVVVLDELQSVATTTDAGGALSTETVVIDPVTATLHYGRHAFVEVGGANLLEVEVAFRGRGDVLVDGTVAVVVGDDLFAVNASNALVTIAAPAGEKCIGIAKVAVPSGTAVVEVDFDGLHGWGNPS